MALFSHIYSEIAVEPDLWRGDAIRDELALTCHQLELDGFTSVEITNSMAAFTYATLVETIGIEAAVNHWMQCARTMNDVITH